MQYLCPEYNAMRCQNCKYKEFLRTTHLFHFTQVIASNCNHLPATVNGALKNKVLKRYN